MRTHPCGQNLPASVPGADSQIDPLQTELLISAAVLAALAEHFRGALVEEYGPLPGKWLVRAEHGRELTSAAFVLRGCAAAFSQAVCEHGCRCVLVPPAGFP